MFTKTRTITMDDSYHRKARIISANLNIDSVSALYRYFIDREWKEHYSEYKNFSLNNENDQSSEQ